MQKVYTITGVPEGVLEVRSEEEAVDIISVCIGTAGRTVNGKLVNFAAQNARNTGFKPDTDLQVVNTIAEAGNRTGSLIIKNHPNDSKLVIVAIDGTECTVTFVELSQAVIACSRNSKPIHKP